LPVASSRGRDPVFELATTNWQLTDLSSGCAAAGAGRRASPRATR
jgi:hypothetical protein